MTGNQMERLSCVLIGILIGVTLVAVLIAFFGCECSIRTNQTESITLSDIYEQLREQNEFLNDFIMKYKIEKEIEDNFKEATKKYYYAFIIDQNSPFYKYDKYEVFLLDSPRLSDYDPNTSEWFLIDSFKICGSDPNCIRRVMGYRSEDENNLLYKLHWVWSEEE